MFVFVIPFSGDIVFLLVGSKVLVGYIAERLYKYYIILYS